MLCSLELLSSGLLLSSDKSLEITTDLLLYSETQGGDGNCYSHHICLTLHHSVMSLASQYIQYSMRITFIYKFLRSHTNCFMEGLPPIFSDYKLVKIIDIATYEIGAGVTKMKQKQIKA